MDRAKSLSVEILKITSSQYAISLKGLHDVLQHVNTSDIRQWARGNDCQIHDLVSVVLDGLPLWPYTLEIVQSLSTVDELRNAFIQQDPVLLSSLLKRAIGSQHENSIDTSTCIMMLSSPLPSEVPMPALVPSFLSKLLDQAINAPSTSTIRPIYRVLSGIGVGLLNALPRETIARLQEQLIKMLRDLKDHSGNLLCLAIFSRIAIIGPLSPCSKPFSSPPRSLAPIAQDVILQSDVCEIARQFFSTKKAPKTLDLVVLKAILVCANSSDLNHFQAVDSLKLAREIVNAIGSDEKKCWIQNNFSKIKKLYEKVTRQSCDHVVRIAAFEVIAALSSPSHLPSNLLESLEDSLQQPCTFFEHKAVIKIYAGHFRDDFVSRTFMRILRLATEQQLPTITVITSLDNAIHFVSGFMDAVECWPRLRRTLVLAILSNDFAESIRQLSSISHLSRNCDKRDVCQEVCPITLNVIQLNLQRDICLLLIKSTLYSTSDETRINLCLMNLLLTKVAALNTAFTVCSALPPRSRMLSASSSLFEVGATPEANTAGSCWRKQLEEELSKDAAYRNEIMVRRVGEVCRDLEERCENAEQPLREERARSSNLQDQLKECRTRIEEQSCASKELAMLLDGLEAEKNQLAAELRASESHCLTLSTSLEETQRQVEYAEQGAVKAAAAATEATQKRQIEYSSLTTIKDDIIDSQSRKITSIEIHAKQLEKDLAQLQSESHNLHKCNINFMAIIQARDEHIKEASLSLTAQKIETAKLRDSLTAVNIKLQSATLGLEHAESRLASLQSESRTRQLEMESVIDDMQKSYDAKTSSREFEITRQKKLLRDLRVELDKEKSRVILTEEQQEQKIARLMRKIENLNKERQKRAKEFAEAQELGSKLTALMGSKPNSLGPSRSSHELSHADDKHQLQQSEDESLVVLLDQSSESSTSSKSGSTPKRNRPRRSSRAPVSQQLKLNLGYKNFKTARGSTRRSGRYPFTDLSLDVQNEVALVTSQVEGICSAVGPGAENIINVDGVDIGDLSFADSDVFTSTDQRVSLEDKGQVGLGIYDDTTADFQM